MIKAAVLAGSVGLLLSARHAGAQVIGNPGWEAPTDAAGFGTDSTVASWTMDPTVQTNGTAGNPGFRDSFYNNTPGGNASFWLQTFEASGDAFQTLSGVTPGLNYNFTSQMLFELGNGTTEGPGNGFDAITVANNPGNPTANPPVPPNTAPIKVYLQMLFKNAANHVIATDETDIGPTVTLDRKWAPYSVTGVAPVGATQVTLVLGWVNGGGDGNTGGQSAFADDATLNVPEPASIGLLGMGGMALLARRRAKRSV